MRLKTINHLCFQRFCLMLREINNIMRRFSGKNQKSPGKLQQKAHRLPLGDETDTDNNTDSYHSPSPDPNQTNYSLENTPNRGRAGKENMPREQQNPVRKGPKMRVTARKSTGLSRNPNTSNREVTDMDITQSNRRVRSSTGPNHSDTDEQPSTSRGFQQTKRKQSKPRRFKPGARALKEIRHYQTTVAMLIPKLPFSRLVREMLQTYSRHADIRVTREAFMAMQEASEMYLVNFFEDSVRLAIHAKRVTLMNRDMQLVSHLRRNWSGI